MKQVIFYSKRVAAFALACFVVVFSIGFSSSAATVATDLHADINMNVEIKYTDGTFSQSDPELIGKTPFNVDPEDWAMAAPPVFSNKQISHVRVNTDLTGYQVPTNQIPPDPVYTLSGKWQFREYISMFDITENLIQPIDFSVTGMLDADTVAALKDELNSAGFSFTFPVQAYSFVCTYDAISLFVGFSNDVENGEHYYRILSYENANFVSTPYNEEVNYIGNMLLSGDEAFHSDYGWMYYAYYSNIDFGSTPQEVSAEFYEWFIANADPIDGQASAPVTPSVAGKTVQLRVLYRVELGLARDVVSSISVNSATSAGGVWTALPYTTISSTHATDTSTGSSYIDATIQFTLPADSEILRVYGTFYTSPFTASNIGEVVGGVQVCEFLYLDPVTDQDPSDKVEVDRVDGVVSDKLDQTGQITDTIEQLQKPSVDVNGSGAPVIGGMVVDPMQQVDPENFGSYTSVIGAIFGSGTILGYFVIAFSMIFISYVIFGKSG